MIKDVKKIIYTVLDSINDSYMDSYNVSNIITDYIEVYYKYTLKIQDESNLELEYVYKYTFLATDKESCWNLIETQIKRNEIPINHNKEYSCLHKENILSNLIEDKTILYYGPTKSEILKCFIFDNYDVHVYY
jgi:hypothetical protein